MSSNSTSTTATTSWKRRAMQSIVSYALYMHRLELQRPKRCRRLMRMASTKLQLTNELIWLEQRHWELRAPSYQQLSALNRESEYRDILRFNMQQQLQKQQQRQRQNLQQATLNKRH